MGEQLFNSDPLFAEAAKLRDVQRDRIGQADLPAFDQDQDQVAVAKRPS